jgi:hypothetical protein
MTIVDARASERGPHAEDDVTEEAKVFGEIIRPFSRARRHHPVDAGSVETMSHET